MFQLRIGRDIEHLGSLESIQEAEVVLGITLMPLSCSPNVPHTQILPRNLNQKDNQCQNKICPDNENRVVILQINGKLTISSTFSWKQDSDYLSQGWIQQAGQSRVIVTYNIHPNKYLENTVVDGAAWRKVKVHDYLLRWWTSFGHCLRRRANKVIGKIMVDTRRVRRWHSRIIQCQCWLAHENQSSKHKDNYVMMNQKCRCSTIDKPTIS